MLPIRQAPLNIQRARQRNQNLVLPLGALLRGPDDSIVNGAHAVPEARLGGAQLCV